MEAARIRAERDRLAREHGLWRDRIALGPGVATIDQAGEAGDHRAVTVLQTVADALDKDLGASAVLDLGAAEGRYAVDFARHGAQVTALEGRQSNFEKMLFVRNVLGLDNLEVVKDDVRNLAADSHGRFDAVLCLGLLYHLEADDAIDVIHRIASVTRRVALFDTHVAPRPKTKVTVRGHGYSGRRVREFDRNEPPDEQEQLSWSAIGNSESFWFTRPSLLNALSRAGFTSVHEVLVPRFAKQIDRVVLLAFPGEPRAVVAATPGAARPVPTWPEREPRRAHPNATWRGTLKLALAPFAPRALKRFARWRRDHRRAR